MKRIFLIFCFSIGVNSPCQTTDPNKEVQFEVVVEDLVNNYNLPKDGYYYEYQFESRRDEIKNVEDFLREYISSGVVLLDAWYKHGSSSCSPPNSQYVMQVIVEPDFVLRIRYPRNFLLNKNLIELDKPPRFFCGYRVMHFIPKND